MMIYSWNDYPNRTMTIVEFYHIDNKSDEEIVMKVFERNYYNPKTMETIKEHKPHLVDRINKLMVLK